MRARRRRRPAPSAPRAPRRPVPRRITLLSKVFAPLALGGSEGHADELEAGMAQTVARLKANGDDVEGWLKLVRFA